MVADQAGGKEIVMYSRSFGCPFVTVAKRVFSDYAISYREVHIDRDSNAKKRVVEWTGFQSVPTIIVADAGSDLPCASFDPLPSGMSPRGIDRGVMITEPSFDELTAWLVKHGFIQEVEAR